MSVARNHAATLTGTPIRRWLRLSTSVMMVLIIGGMVAIGAQRVRKQATPTVTILPGGGSGDDQVDKDMTGFELIESIAGQVMYALKSERTLGKSSGWYEIEGVRLQMYDEGEEGPILTADTASYNPTTREARLMGPVTIEYPNGALLNTDSASFEGRTRRVVADSNVVYMSGDTVGHAGRAVFSLEEDRLVLTDDAVMATTDGVALRAPHIVYERDDQVVTFPEGCRVQSGASSVVAQRATVDLDALDGAPRRIVFSGGVVAEGLGESENVVATAERVVASREPGGNWQIDATSVSSWIEVLSRGGEGFFERSLRTLALRGVLGPDGLISLHADHAVCIEEIPMEGAPRRAEARNARVWFESGEAADVELADNVVLYGEGVEGRGYRARVVREAGIVLLYGDPTGPERATLVSDRGRISCDQAQMFDREGRVEARGNVQGKLDEAVMLGTVEEEDSPPLHFAAEVLDISEGGTVLRLREGARIWQGNRLLLADEITYWRDDDRMRASGHVRTTLPASQLDATAAEGEDVVVVARSFEFDRAERNAVYRGSVRYSDPGNMLSATELWIEFDDNDKVSAVEAVGNLELLEVATGRRVTGQRARREVADETILITGSPAQLEDGRGNVVSGESLTWNQADGSVAVTGDTETTYIPEETP